MTAPAPPNDDPISDALRAQVDDLETQRRIDQALIAYLRDEVANGELGIEHLEAALGSCRRIGAAIGIVMHATKVTEDEAFAVISAISQRRNRKLRVVADDIVLTGTIE